MNASRFRPSPALVVSLLALFVALGGAGMAATGDNLILGQPNTADKTTAVTASTPIDPLACPAPCPALQVTNTSTAANAGALNVWGRSPSTAAATLRNSGSATALRLITSPGVPPLTTSSSTKVANLNADRLDGLDSSALWQLGGNAGTSPPATFLGTTDAQPLVVKTNGAERLRVTSTGDVGIGTDSPAYKLHVGLGNGLRVEGPSAPVDGTAVSVGGYGNVRVDSPGSPGGRFVVRESGNIGIGKPNPTAKLQVSANSTNGGNNTAEFGDPAIGPNLSHIHWGPSGDWYIRSAANGGRVVIQDTAGNVGIGTASPGEKLTVNGTVESSTGGFKFPDGSVQPSAAGSVFTTSSFGTATDLPPKDGGQITLAQLTLPPGGWLIEASALFRDTASFAFSENSRTVRCFLAGEIYLVRPGGAGGNNDWVTLSAHTVKVFGTSTTVQLNCEVLDGGTDKSYVYSSSRRMTAVRASGVTVQ